MEGSKKLFQQRRMKIIVLKMIVIDGREMGIRQAVPVEGSKNP
jgi:hypothetical protein